MSEKNPVLKVSKLIGQKVTVSGFVKESMLCADKGVFVIGKLGVPMHPPKFSTDFKIVILPADIDQFKSLKNVDLVDNYAFVTGKVIRFHNQIVVQLNNRRDIRYETFKHPLILR